MFSPSVQPTEMPSTYHAGGTFGIMFVFSIWSVAGAQMYRCTNSSMHDCEETFFFQFGTFSSVINFASSYFDICPSAKCVLRTTFVFCNCKDKNIDIYLYSTCFSNNLHQGTGARGTDLPLPFFLTFYIQIYFQ